MERRGSYVRLPRRTNLFKFTDDVADGVVVTSSEEPEEGKENVRAGAEAMGLVSEIPDGCVFFS